MSSDPSNSFAVQMVANEIEKAMVKLSKHFTTGMKLTFVMRDPANDECVLIKTDDVLSEVSRVLEIYAGRAKAGG